MIARLLLFVLMYGAIFLVPGGLVAALGWKALKPWRERRKRLKQGQQNAKLLAAHEDETCFECRGPIDPKEDVYYPRIGWAHRACYRDLF